MLVDTVLQFLKATHTFHRLYAQYRRGLLSFGEWAKFVDDRGESVLFNLKERSQQIYQHGPFRITEKEQIFDLTIRSIFHLAMKLREDLYTLEIFAPKYAELRKIPSDSAEKRNLLEKFQVIIARAETSLREGMEEIAGLIQDSSRQFRELLSDYCHNGLLIRFFIEEADFIKTTIGAQAFDECLRTLSGGDQSEAYRLAGESYFESAFFDRALQAFARALEENPDDEGLQFKMQLSQGMKHFFSFAFPEALNCLEKCLALSDRIKILEEHRAMIRKVCQKIQEDFPGRRKNDLHRHLIHKARSIYRKVEKMFPAPSHPHSDQK